jgi:hypothetical protein
MQLHCWLLSLLLLSQPAAVKRDTQSNNSFKQIVFSHLAGG